MLLTPTKFSLRFYSYPSSNAKRNVTWLKAGDCKEDKLADCFTARFYRTMTKSKVGDVSDPSCQAEFFFNGDVWNVEVSLQQKWLNEGARVIFLGVDQPEIEEDTSVERKSIDDGRHGVYLSFYCDPDSLVYLRLLLD